MLQSGFCRVWLVGVLVGLIGSVALAENARVVVLTDIRTQREPDDAESMLRLLTYSNVIDIKGLVVNTSTYGRSVVSDGTGLTNIQNILNTYQSSAYNNLKQLDSRFPTAASLQAVTVNGQSTYSTAGVGAGKSSAGSNLIIDEVLNNPNDTRPLWVLGWGGVNTLAQALYDVKNNTRAGKTYTQADLNLLTSRIRVFDVAGQDAAGAQIAQNFPDVTYYRSKYQFRAMSYRVDGIWNESRGGDERKVSQQWFTNNVSSGHGAYGSAYKHAHYLYEGDTVSFLHLIPNGLGDSEHMDWGGWGGRFNETETQNPGNSCGVSESGYTYSMNTGATDTWTADQVLVNNTRYGETSGTTTTNNKTYSNNLYAPLLRWREAFQNDFAARMDWAAGHAGANRNPVAVLNGDTTEDILFVGAAPGSTLSLSATGSYDPDGDGLTYAWWVYEEAGDCLLPLTVLDAGSAEASLLIPDAAAEGEQIHVILEIVDTNSTAQLTSYRREIVTVTPEPASMALLGVAGLALLRRRRRR